MASKDKIMLAALDHVPFDGWTRVALATGAKDIGLDPEEALLAFPDGIPDLVDHLATWADGRMLAALAEMDLKAMPVRDRIAAGVRVRLQALVPHREAVRRLAAYLAMPQNLPLAARLTWRTVDAIWYAAGDEASDFNYYTKRGLLAPVLTTTALYWLNDESPDFADTWAFLDRRIGDAMKVPGLKARFEKALSSFRPFRKRRGAAGKPRPYSGM